MGRSLRGEGRGPVRHGRLDRREGGRGTARSRWTSPSGATISTRPTENFEAYSYFLRGEALRTAPEDALNAVPRAVAMYERAVALDPKFALAFARLVA